jgi:hypothetical protein
MKLTQLVAVIATAFSLQFAHGANLYTAATAPDAASREALSHTLKGFDDGAMSPDDVAAAVHRNYPIVIEQGVAARQPADADVWFDQMSELELEHIAQLYVNSNADQGRTGKLLYIMAARLDGARLARLSRHFGYNEVYAAIQSTAPAKLAAFSALAKTATPAPIAGAALRIPAMTIKLSGGGFVSTMASFTPTTSMTFSELYTGFRSMQTGSMAAPAAFFEVLEFTGKKMWPATVGYAIGTGISAAMQTYAPDWYMNSFVPAVGGSIYNSQMYLQNSAGTIYNDLQTGVNALGNYQSSLMPIFALSPAVQGQMASTGGDYGMCYEYQEVEAGGGGSCGREGCYPHQAE